MTVTTIVTQEASSREQPRSSDASPHCTAALKPGTGVRMSGLAAAVLSFSLGQDGGRTGRRLSRMSESAMVELRARSYEFIENLSLAHDRRHERLALLQTPFHIL